MGLMMTTRWQVVWEDDGGRCQAGSSWAPRPPITRLPPWPRINAFQASHGQGKGERGRGWFGTWCQGGARGGRAQHRPARQGCVNLVGGDDGREAMGAPQGDDRAAAAGHGDVKAASGPASLALGAGLAGWWQSPW